MTKFNPVIATVLFCHFLSSFTVLGMPLFLPKIMAEFLGNDQQMLIGWFYILPTICTAITSPWWGKFADKYGKRFSLIRAQLGLALGFLIAGFAPNLTVFALGLIIQGCCGGTFSASNAYLASQISNAELAKTLNLTQFSARLSLVVAPIVLGAFMSIDQPLTLYIYLSFLPILAAVSISQLPSIAKKHVEKPIEIQTSKVISSLSFNRILILNFLFSFAVVVSFPYFYSYMQMLGTDNSRVIGWYFSLPHLVYLIIITTGDKWQKKVSANRLCILGLSALILAAFCQYQASASTWVTLWRVIMGFGICLTYIGMHQCISALKTEKSGLMFGKFDSASKWAGVLAGLGSGVVVQFIDLRTPFILSALSAGIAMIILITPSYADNSQETEYAK